MVYRKALRASAKNSPPPRGFIKHSPLSLDVFKKTRKITIALPAHIHMYSAVQAGYPATNKQAGIWSTGW
jgi:hypothetical protein